MSRFFELGRCSEPGCDAFSLPLSNPPSCWTHVPDANAWFEYYLGESESEGGSEEQLLGRWELAHKYYHLALVKRGLAAEISDREVKRYEVLYQLAKEAFWAEFERFDTVEGKANRYATLILAALGASAFAAGKLADVVTASPKRFEHWLFMVASALFYIFAVNGLIQAVRVLRSRKVPAIHIGEDLVKHFKEHSYLTAIFSQAKEFLKEAGKPWKSAAVFCSYSSGV